MRFLTTIIAFLIGSYGCGKGQSPRRSPEKLPLTSSGSALLYVGTDAKFESSSVFLLPVDGTVANEILTGQSGDGFVQDLGGEIYLFNRQPGNQNFRRIDILSGTKAKFGRQLALRSKRPGDPHHALKVGDNTALVADYNAGQILVTDLASGAQLENLSEGWDLPSGAPLRPESFFEAGSIYVLHQGIGANFEANKTQRILVLERDGDAFTASRRSIATEGTNPLGFFSAGNSDPLILSLCFRSMPNCHAALERFDSVTERVTMIMDLDKSGYSYNGMATTGESSEIVYANVEKKVSEGSYRQFVVRINATTKSIEEIHEFPAREIGGYWWTYFHAGSEQLYVGDRRDMQRGMFTVYKNTKKLRIIELDAIPYSGTKVTW